jgi:hypothetical protein
MRINSNIRETMSFVKGKISCLIRLRRRPRLRAETVACMGPFGEDRHFGVQARALPVDECVNCARIIHELKYCCFGGFR